MTNTEVGKLGEIYAARYLRKKGYKILSINFSCRFGEIDIIARKKQTVIFVEVKARRNIDYILPKEAVDYFKQSKIKKTSLAFISEFGLNDDNFRYDIIEVLVSDKNKFQINHIENAFD